MSTVECDSQFRLNFTHLTWQRALLGHATCHIMRRIQLETRATVYSTHSVYVTILSFIVAFAYFSSEQPFNFGLVRNRDLKINSCNIQKRFRWASHEKIKWCQNKKKKSGDAIRPNLCWCERYEPMNANANANEWSSIKDTVCTHCQAFFNWKLFEFQL